MWDRDVSSLWEVLTDHSLALHPAGSAAAWWQQGQWLAEGSFPAQAPQPSALDVKQHLPGGQRQEQRKAARK